MVTADGEFLRASVDEHADLLLGLRGGGGNFGVVTSFGYSPAFVGPTVLAGIVLYPAARAREVLASYQEFVANSARRADGIVVLTKRPSRPRSCRLGPRAVRRDHRSVLCRLCRRGRTRDRWTAADRLAAGGHSPAQRCTSAPGAARPRGAARARVLLEVGVRGGAGRPDRDAGRARLARGHAESYTIISISAAPSRERIPRDRRSRTGGPGIQVNIDAVWSNPDRASACVALNQNSWEAIHGPRTDHVYVNFLGAQTYAGRLWDAKYERLRARSSGRTTRPSLVSVSTGASRP